MAPVTRMTTLPGRLAGVMLLALLCAAPLLWGQAPAAGAAAAREPWMDAAPASTGIAVGKKIPPFRLRDQNGKLQDFDSVRGPQGAVIYFNRSADW